MKRSKGTKDSRSAPHRQITQTTSDARGTEAEIRKQLIESNAVDVIVLISSKFFYTVTLACTLWFLDKNKLNTERKDKILFIDTREIYTQIDRAHREFTLEQIDQITDTVRSYRKEGGSRPYEDIIGFCKVTTIEEIRKQNYSLNAGRYVGTSKNDEGDFNFAERLEELKEEIESLNKESRELEDLVSENLEALIEEYQ